MPRTEGQYNRGPNLATPWLAVARVALTPFGKVLLCPFRALGPNHGVRIGCWTARERTGSRTGIPSRSKEITNMVRARVTPTMAP